MNEKFNDIPMDKDTKILFSSPMKWGDLDIVYQKWNWEGILAESMIFLNEDMEEMNDEALEAYVRDGPLVRKDSRITIRRLENFTFVNFNFIS